ncbi:phage tail tape measure C-terminal domain-containing protein [Acidovorax sp.]|uniref:phage tail tape measure C-terminal domain-containing protein n=1 Tax=Acidovorax sp. TaxID=1872122 RepID=UPI00391F9471
MSNFSSIAELRLSVVGGDKLLETSREMDKVTTKTREYNKETANTSAAQRRAESDADKFLRKLREQADAVGKTKVELQTMRAAQLGVANDAKPMLDKLAEAQKKSVSFKDTLANLTGEIKGLSGSFANVATGGASAGEGIASASTALRGLGPVAMAAGAGVAAIAATFAAFLVVGAAVAAVAAAITLKVAGAAAAVDDLSNETGIAAERLSLLQSLAAEGGSSFEAWNQAATGLATKLAKQDEESGKVALALKELGVSTKDANGEQKTHIELMREVVVAAANHKDAAKGQALGLVALGSEYNKLKTSVLEADEKQSRMYDTMKKTGQLMSTSLAKQSGDFMDKIDHLKGAFMGMAQSIATTVLPYLDKFLGKIVSAAQTAASIIRRFTGNSTAAELSGEAAAKARGDVAASTAAIAKMEASPMHTQGGDSQALKNERAKLAAAQERLREANKLNDAAVRGEADATALALKGDPSAENKVGGGVVGKPDKDKATKEKDPYSDWMDKTRLGTSEAIAELNNEEKLNSAQKDRVKFLDEIASGKLKITEIQKNEFLAANSLLALAQQEAKEQQANAEGEKKNAVEQEARDKRRIELEKARADILTGFRDKGLENIATQERELTQQGLTTREIKLQNDLHQIELDLKKTIHDLTKDITNEEEKAAIATKARAEANDLIASRKGLESKFAAKDGDGTAGFLQGLKKYAGEAKTTFEVMEEAGTRVAGTLENAFSNMARTGRLSFADMARSVIADLGAIFAKMAITGLFKWIIGGVMGAATSGTSTNSMYSLSSGSTSSIGLKFPGRAAGGPVSAGQTTWVGEQGPELVKFGASGSVVPNHQRSSTESSGGVTNHITVTVQGGTTNEETGAIVARAVAEALKQVPGIADSRIATQRRPGGISNPLAARAF